MEYEELSDEELRQLLLARIALLSDSDCESILIKKDVAENRAS